MKKAIEVFRTNKGTLPRRVVDHKTSRYIDMMKLRDSKQEQKALTNWISLLLGQEILS